MTSKVAGNLDSIRDIIVIDDDDDCDEHGNDCMNVTCTEVDRLSLVSQNELLPNKNQLLSHTLLSTLLPHEVDAIKTCLDVLSIPHDGVVYENSLRSLHCILKQCSWSIEDAINKYFTSTASVEVTASETTSIQLNSIGTSCYVAKKSIKTCTDPKKETQSTLCLPYNCQTVTSRSFKRSLFPEEEESISDTNFSHACTSEENVKTHAPSRKNAKKSGDLDVSGHTVLSSVGLSRNTKNSLTYFVDPQFPPMASSLDGRKRITTLFHSGEDDDHSREKNGTGQKNQTRGLLPSLSKNIVMCFCGVPAAAKQVQSDGPNYGRFYLSCGITNIPQKRRAPVLVVKSPDKKVESTSNNKDVNNCSVDKKRSTPTRLFSQNPYAKKQKLDNNDGTNIQSPLKTKIEPSSSTSISSSTSSSPLQQRKQPCTFFQWDPDGSKGAENHRNHSSGYASVSSNRISWYHFGLENGCTLYKNTTIGSGCKNRQTCCADPSHVIQGAVGNCWFLSALAVVAEKSYLIDRIIQFDSLNEQGVYDIQLCLDGRWETIRIDSFLPVIIENNQKEFMSSTTTRSPIHKRPKKRRLDVKNLANGVRVEPIIGNPLNGRIDTETMISATFITMAFPAFCGTPGRQLWPAFIEKAYAKAHGSYAQLCAGFISEGLQDLTGAPTETHVFRMTSFSKESFWEQLKSYRASGFLMGVATAAGGDGLVGGHAYSVLAVIEITDYIIGEQAKVTDYFNCTTACTNHAAVNVANEIGNKHCKEGFVLELETNQSQQQHEVTNSFLDSPNSPGPIRLLRIRNPWGVREWKGDWSSHSERWTKALRHRIGVDNSFATNDGTFFMSFEDMLTKFHHMDVAKTREGWIHASADGEFQQSTDPMTITKFVYKLENNQTTPVRAYITVILPKKRSNVQSTYWYCDPSFLVLRSTQSTLRDDEFHCEACILSGVKRENHCEITLEPKYTYWIVPFSFLICQNHTKQFSFRVTLYSSDEINIDRVSNNLLIASAARRHLHKDLLSREPKLLYPVAHCCVLACVHRFGCLFFIAVNGNQDHYLSMKLTIPEKDGILISFGNPDDSHDIAPRSQKLLVVVSRHGKFISNTTHLHFRYLTSVVTITRNHMENKNKTDWNPPCLKLNADFDITLAGDLITNNILEPIQMKGSDDIDMSIWIPQIGSGT